MRAGKRFPARVSIIITRAGSGERAQGSGERARARTGQRRARTGQRRARARATDDTIITHTAAAGAIMASAPRAPAALVAAVASSSTARVPASPGKAA